MRVVLTDGKGPSGAFIRWYTWSWAAHAGVELTDGIIDATPSRGVSLHAGIDGTQIRHYTILGLTPVIELAVRKFLIAQKGKPYDWSAIVGLGIRRDWYSDDKWFCSELVAAAFEQAGLPLLNTLRSNRITPRDLELSPLLLRDDQYA